MKHLIKTITALFLTLLACPKVSHSQENACVVPELSPLTDTTLEEMRRMVSTSYSIMARMPMIAAMQTEGTMSVGDSLFMFMQEAVRNRPDTVSLNKALEIMDRMSEDSMTWSEKYSYYKQRMEILAFMGRYDEAIDAFNKITYEEDSPNEFTRLGLCALNENKLDLAGIYFSKSINLCDEKLSAKYNSDLAVSRLEATYYLFGEREAKKFLDMLIKKHYEDYVLLGFKDNWKSMTITFECNKYFREYLSLLHDFMQQPYDDSDFLEIW